MQLLSFMNTKRGIEIFENEKCQKFEVLDRFEIKKIPLK